MTDTERLLALDRAHVWHPFTQAKQLEASPPWVVDHAEGVWLHTADGRRLLDGISSWWVNLLGHRDPRLDAALKAQVDKVAHVMFANFTHQPAVDLAAGLARLAPSGLDRVFFSDNGSTAVEVALKMAFQYWQNRGRERVRFIAFDRAYHGDTLGAVAVGGVEAYHAHWAPLLFPVLRAPSPYRWPLPPGATAEDGSRASIAGVRALLAAYPGEVAAIIVEPMIQAAGGMATHPPSFLKELRALADAHDTLLIFDEVATGFLRTGKMWASDHAGVRPDIMAISKAVTGGYLPLGATLCTDAIYQAFYGDAHKTFYHGHSYTANPLAAALGCEVVRIVSDPDFQADVEARAHHLQRTWQQALSGQRHVADLRGVGFVAAASLLADPDLAEPFDPALQIPQRICARAAEQGLFIRPLGDSLYLWPPLVITQAEVEWACGVIADSITEVIRQR